MGKRSNSEETSGGVKKGPWLPEEDSRLTDYIKKHGHGSWTALPHLAGLNRCGKSCRLRWTNYLRPDIKRGMFSHHEEVTIIHLHSLLGNKWSAIASHLPGRTDNEIKNFWNTRLRKKLLRMGIDPVTHTPRPHPNILPSTFHPHCFVDPTCSSSFSNLQIAEFELLRDVVMDFMTTNNYDNYNSFITNGEGGVVCGGGGDGVPFLLDNGGPVFGDDDGYNNCGGLWRGGCGDDFYRSSDSQIFDVLREFYDDQSYLGEIMK